MAILNVVDTKTFAELEQEIKKIGSDFKKNRSLSSASLNKFTDLKNNSHWAFYAIEKAANTHLANSANNTETWAK